VSIVFRARRRIRSRRLAHPRGLARRFLAGQRPEGVDDRRALFGLRSIAGTHRRQCAQAHRPDDVLDRHEDPGCGGAADSPDVRWIGFQRSLSDRCAGAGQSAVGRRRRRLEGGTGHIDERTGGRRQGPRAGDGADSGARPVDPARHRERVGGDPRSGKNWRCGTCRPKGCASRGCEP